jgi:hypothetical protein
MSVTNTSYTTNSYTVTVANELVDSNNTIAGVNTAIIALGWSYHDGVDQTTYSPMVTKVYRVLNTDGVTYKYAILRWDTLQLKLTLSCSEDWNASTHVATNESWHNAGAFYLGYDLRDCIIYVAATARHLVLYSKIRGESSLWAGIFEFERIAAEDVGSNTAPCFAYTNSLMIGTPWGQAANNDPAQYIWAFPRTADNQTGSYAAKAYGTFTTRGQYPPYYPSANTGNTGANSVAIVTTHDGNALHLGSFYNTIGGWGWDSSKVVVSPVTVDHIFKSMPFGRAYNMAVTKPIGQDSFDSTYVNLDSTGGWPTATGTNTEMLILSMNGGSETEFANTVGRLSISYSNNSSIIYSSVCAVGNTVFAAANTGVYTWSLNAGSNTSAIQRYNNSNGVNDIIFDGKRSIWGTTNNGIIQIDTETYATNANIAADLGCMGIAMDQKYVYASSRSRNVLPKLYRFWRANANLAAHMNCGAALAATTSFGKPVPDYKGFVYAVTQLGAQTSGSGVMRQIVWDSESANANVGASNNQYSAAVTSAWQSSFYYEPTIDTMYFITNEAATTRSIIYSNVPNTNVWTTVFSNTAPYTSIACGATFTYNPSFAVTGAHDFVGDLVFAPIRGWVHVTPRRTGANQTSNTGFHSMMSLQYPDSPGGTGTPYAWVNMTTNDVINSANGFPAHQWTNGVRIFQTIWRNNTESRIISIGNLYPNTQFNTYATGRLLVKA